jgi:hypothetical protein
MDKEEIDLFYASSESKTWTSRLKLEERRPFQKLVLDVKIKLTSKEGATSSQIVL